MFYDQSPEFLPPLFDTALRPPDGAFAFTGITTSAAAADFNGDGLMDLTTAEGGLFSMGDYPQFFFNSGPPRQEPFRPFNEGLTIFKPIGSGVPARFILPPLASSSFQPAEGGINAPRILNGYIGEEIGAYYGVSVGDFSGDGYPDLFYTRDGQGPISFLNVDGSVAVGLIGGGETTINSFPDSDINPDGVFVGLNQISGLPGFPMLLPDLTDPCPDPSGSIVLKKMNRRMAAADFDGNGKLDVCIANGIQGSGAPNVLLLNSPVMVFPFPVPFPWFTDATESNLPTVLGDCGMPTGIMDDSYDVAAADFDHDGDIDIVFANQSNTSLTLAFPGFRYLANDGTGVFTDTNASLGNIPEFLNTKPRALIIGDFDGVGEWTEDLNGNGILDAGEDTNGNGILDRSEDVNGNGILDPGEDLNGNGVLDFVDLPDETVAGDVNGDGIITKRTAGVWEPSFDIFVCFADRTNAILINDPTNQTPGIFAGQSTIRLPAFPLDGSMALQSGGGRACDLDKDGKLDILVAKQTFNSFMRPVQYLHNDGGGFFSDKSYEFPFPTSVRGFGESGPTSISYTGNASDVEVLDVDNDGDLDVYVGMAGRGESLQTIGAMDVMYINRLNGGNFNTGALTLPPTTPPPLAKPPLVFAVNPGSAVQGSVNLNVDVIGTRFEFTPTTTLNFGAGITVNSVTFVDANHLVANITISPTAQVGPRSVSVQNPSNGLSSSTVSGIFNVADDTSGNAVALKEWIRYE
ncbi:VCBS repeat-containing protein [Candidatus Sumerlaeota bacterium]|nr:VCBS repeat-containing protein [Candidatus Sumerlaeota bacterium]